jgi:hypothetical protein
MGGDEVKGCGCFLALLLLIVLVVYGVARICGHDIAGDLADVIRESMDDLPR